MGGLSELCRVLRVYVNFFSAIAKTFVQKKKRSKNLKKYDTAKTSHQRVIMVKTVDQSIKNVLNEQYKN
jgi:hypothetical protein